MSYYKQQNKYRNSMRLGLNAYNAYNSYRGNSTSTYPSFKKKTTFKPYPIKKVVFKKKKKTTFKKKYDNAENADGHVSYFKTITKSYGKKCLPKSAVAGLGQKIQRDVAQGVYTSTIGKQVVANTAFGIFTKSSFNTYVSGTSTYPAITSVKFILTGWTNKQILCNRSNNTMFLWMYDLMCIKNTSRDPATLFNDGVEAEVGSVGTAENNIWCSPLGPQGSLLRQYWKIVNYKKIALAPGQSVVHTYYHNYNNKCIDSETIQNSDTDYIAGITTASLIRQHGNISGSGSSISTDGVSLAIVTDSSKTWKQDTAASNTLTITGNHPTFLATDNVLNIDSGTVVASVDA